MLVAAPERWDEACFAVPALRALAASGPRTGVFCPEEQRSLWSTLDGVTVVSFPKGAKVSGMAAAVAGIWEAGLSWEVGFAAEVFKIAGIPKRLGLADRRFRKLLTHHLGLKVEPLEHRVRHYLAAVEELGVETGRPEFFAPADLGVMPVRGSVLLCPESDFGPNHEWLAERWQEIGMALARSGHRVTVAGIRSARAMAGDLAARLGSEVELLQLEAFEKVLPVLAAYEWVISVDGSLPHLAAHVGPTCITLFGPNDPAWKRPLGRRHLVVRQPVECAPCLMAKCPLDLRCQAEMETARVLRAVSNKIADVQAAATSAGSAPS